VLTIGQPQPDDRRQMPGSKELRLRFCCEMILAPAPERGVCRTAVRRHGIILEQIRDAARMSPDTGPETVIGHQ
jgi:hypothetical protein